MIIIIIFLLNFHFFNSIIIQIFIFLKDFSYKSMIHSLTFSITFINQQDYHFYFYELGLLYMTIFLIIPILLLLIVIIILIHFNLQDLD